MRNLPLWTLSWATRAVHTVWPPWRDRPGSVAIPQAKGISRLMPAPFQPRNKSPLLKFVVTQASCSLCLNVSNNLPGQRGKPERFQHLCEQSRRKPRFLVLPTQDAPRRATRQSEYLGLLVKRVKSRCRKGIAGARHDRRTQFMKCTAEPAQSPLMFAVLRIGASR